MTEVMPSIQKIKTVKGAKGMIIETTNVFVQGETLKETKKVFNEVWKE